MRVVDVGDENLSRLHVVVGMLIVSDFLRPYPYS